MTDETKFTVINHLAREALGLSWTEYGLAEMIYHLSNNPDSPKPGWCYASKPAMSRFIGTSEREVFRMIKVLLSSGVIEKDPETKYLRTTPMWYRAVILKDHDKMSGVTKSHGTHDKKSVTTPAKKSGNNDTTENNIDRYPSDTTLPSWNDKADGRPFTNKTMLEAKETIEKLMPPLGGMTSSGPTIATRVAGSSMKPRKEYGRPEITQLIEQLKQVIEVPMLDGSIEQNRQYCWIMIRKFGKTEDGPVDYLRGVQQVSTIIKALKNNEFWRYRMTSFAKLHAHAVEIISSIRDQRGGVINVE